MTKHSSVENQLKDEIASGGYKIGDKLQGENVLSARFGVSRQTIRQALGTLEREGFLERRHGSGTYVKAVSMPKSVEAKTICVMTTYIDDYIFPYIISGIDKVLAASGYDMSLKLTRNRVVTERANLLSLRDGNICGLIVEGTKTALSNPNMDLYSEFDDMPILFINSYYRELDQGRLNYVVVNDKNGARKAVRYLTENGHRKISGIFKIDDMQGHERYNGFLSEICEQNLPFDENNVIWYSTEDRQQLFSPENTQALLNKLGDCTAVVCYNDEVAVSLVRLLGSLGRNVPDDLSVVSFDNSSLAQMSHPGITTIAHPGIELGKEAARSILKLIANPSDCIQYTFDTDLVIRGSVKSIV